MVMCCTAASEPGPRNWISPMWLTSKRPTLVRTAICSAIRPPPGPGYSTGMSQPPKSTILAFRVRCVALRAVFFNAGATVTSEVVIEEFLSQPMLYPTNDRDWAASGSNPARCLSCVESSRESSARNSDDCGLGIRVLAGLADSSRPLCVDGLRTGRSGIGAVSVALRPWQPRSIRVTTASMMQPCRFPILV